MINIMDVLRVTANTGVDYCRQQNRTRERIRQFRRARQSRRLGAGVFYVAVAVRRLLRVVGLMMIDNDDGRTL